jgi:hypothetical protein
MKMTPFGVIFVIRDETWVHHCKPENKSQLMDWKFKTQPVVGAGMSTLFRDSHGPVLEALSGKGCCDKQ